MGRKKNVSSEISKNTKIKAANDADEVNKSDSELQKCKLHPPAISLPSSSYTTITPPPPAKHAVKCKIVGLTPYLRLMHQFSLRLKSLRASHRTT
ncbi:hypothetical protein CWI36_1750p0020 [Hamiltosporidium magnivora]|uniref:Uncharacterized protein n=1 Tax=Hamiltosporidium magnivora TaxID=148818 RepID=A0A4Q9KYM8_9MICR|nr:hypothetical protein CWI36_1750p0020 [Hamiltosporidium magnivora]